MILNLDASKASGPDEISVRMIRGTAPSIAPILAQIFNTSIKTGKIHSVWKASYIVPIPKGTNSTTDSSAPAYRPISLLSVVSKILEKIIHNRVLASLQEACPPQTNQWGFLPERSTSGVLLAATHDWLTELDKGNEVAAVFFDIKKAFDSVPHRLLLHKLQGRGLDAYFFRWISGYLTDRTQAVILNGTTSQSLSCAVWGSPGLHSWTPFIHYLCE